MRCGRECFPCFLMIILMCPIVVVLMTKRAGSEVRRKECWIVLLVLDDPINN